MAPLIINMEVNTLVNLRTIINVGMLNVIKY